MFVTFFCDGVAVIELSPPAEPTEGGASSESSLSMSMGSTEAEVLCPPAALVCITEPSYTDKNTRTCL